MWRECKLADIASRITSGGTPSRKVDHYFNGKIPWLTTKEINFNRIQDTDEKISQEGLDNSSAKYIEPDSVIVAMYGATAGKIAINKIPLTTNQACCNITLNKQLSDYNFVYYYLLDNYLELTLLATGAAQQNLSVGVIENFDIRLPSLPEQKAIASVLSSLDDKIDLLHRQNQTLESMAETLFRQWFVEEDFENQISDLISIQNGYAFKSKDFKSIGTNGVIKIKNINNSIVDINHSDFIADEISFQDIKYQISNQFWRYINCHDRCRNW